MATIAAAVRQSEFLKVGVILCRHHYPLATPDARLLHPRFIETLAAMGLFPEVLHVVHSYAGEELPTADSVSAWIVSGEPFAAGQDTTRTGDLSGVLHSAAAAGIPLYGIGGGERVLAAMFGGPSSQLSTPLKPCVYNPLYSFGRGDRLYRLVPATGSVAACPSPRHYRESLFMRNAVASARGLVRRFTPAHALF